MAHIELTAAKFRQGQLMNLRDFRKSTLEMRKVNARFVVFEQTKTGRHKTTGLNFVAAITHTPKVFQADGTLVEKEPDQINSYVSVITFIDKKANVHVACSCPDNLYRWEYANTKSGASEIEYCNGDFPSIRNPSLRPSLCKHLYALAQSLAPLLDRAHA